MATTYTCDQCGKTSPTMRGWYFVSVQLVYDNPDVPYPPGGRTLEKTLDDAHFDTLDCRTRWLGEHAIES